MVPYFVCIAGNLLKGGSYHLDDPRAGAITLYYIILHYIILLNYIFLLFLSLRLLVQFCLADTDSPIVVVFLFKRDAVN